MTTFSNCDADVINPVLPYVFVLCLCCTAQVMACARGVSILSSSSSVPGETDQFPSLLWSRLLHSLLPSLLEFRRGEGDLLVLNLKHSVLCKVVRERYLESEEKRKQVFAQLSSYFSGKLQGGLHIQGEGQGERGQKVTECVDSSGMFRMRVGVGVGMGVEVEWELSGSGVGVREYLVCIKCIHTAIRLLHHRCRRR